MSTHIYPSELPVGTTQDGPSNYIRERQLTSYMTACASSPLPYFVYGGFELSAGSGLSVNIAAGTAVINGYMVTIDAVGTKSNLGTNTTNYIWVQLLKTSSKVTGSQFYANNTGDTETDAALLGIAITNGSAVTSVVNSVQCPTVFNSTYTGNAASTQYIYLGFIPAAVQISGPYLTGSIISFYQHRAIGANNSAVLHMGDDDIVFDYWGFSVGNTILNTNLTTYTYTAWAGISIRT
jgi:hypothetical protein